MNLGLKIFSPWKIGIVQVKVPRKTHQKSFIWHSTQVAFRSVSAIWGSHTFVTFASRASKIIRRRPMGLWKSVDDPAEVTQHILTSLMGVNVSQCKSIWKPGSTILSSFYQYPNISQCIPITWDSMYLWMYVCLMYLWMYTCICISPFHHPKTSGNIIIIYVLYMYIL